MFEILNLNSVLQKLLKQKIDLIDLYNFKTL